MLKVVRAKLHAIRVTGADLNYHGSITLDPEHCTEAGIYPLEFVETRALSGQIGKGTAWATKRSSSCDHSRPPMGPPLT